MTDELPTEVSHEHLLAFLLLDKERERAVGAIRQAEAEQRLAVNMLDTMAQNYRMLYRMGKDDKFDANGKIKRAAPALRSVPDAENESNG